MKKSTISFLFLFCLSNLYSQVINSMFIQDSEAKTGTQIGGSLKFQQNLIMSGSTPDIINNISRPEIVMIDSNLNILWRFSNVDTTTYTTSAFISTFFLGIDNYLYAEISGSSIPALFIKIDPSNGAILWKIDTSSISANRVGIADLDSTPFTRICNACAAIKKRKQQ